MNKNLITVEVLGNESNKSNSISFIIKFLKCYLKSFPLIIRVVRLFKATALPTIIYYYIKIFINHVTARERQIVSQRDFVKNNHIYIDNIFKETFVKAHTPDVYPIRDKEHLVHSEGEYGFPSVYIALINNAKVYGSSNFVFCNNMAICHDLYDFNHDYTSEEAHIRILIKPKKNILHLFVNDKKPLHLNQAATFLDATASNYAHWLSEVLPRIAVFCANEKYKNIPIIINQDLHRNILDSLSFIIGSSNRVVFALAKNKAIKVDKLYITSATGYVPFDVRPSKYSKHSHDGMFSPQSIKLMRDMILSRIKGARDDSSLPKKVLVMRNSAARGVKNIIELKNILVSKGFQVVEPEKLSFVEQVQLFNNAEHVIAPTGAALGSAIFCSGTARVTVMMGKHQNMIYRYWAEMLQSTGVKLSYLLGEIVGDKALGIHGDYIIDKNDLISLLENAENK